jgi:signal transduction histidine kinase
MRYDEGISTRKKVVSISRIYFYYKWIWPCFAILFLLVPLIGCRYSAPEVTAGSLEARQGVLDARGYRFQQSGKIPLHGDWSFYWKQLLTPGQLVGGINSSPPQSIRLPGSWNTHAAGGELEGNGYATYRLTVLTDDPSARLALHIPFIRTAYRVWVNGELVSEVGLVATDRGDSVPKYRTQQLYFDHNGESIEIVIQVSNFEHRSGGIWKSIELGSTKQIGEAQRRNTSIEVLLIGSMLAMGLHHMGLYVLRRKEKGSIYFGLFCVLIGIRAAFNGEGIIYGFYEGVSWLTALRVEYVCFYLGVPAAVLFAQALYPKEINQPTVRLVQLLGMLFAAIVLVTPSHVFTYTTQPFQAITIAVTLYLLYGLLKAVSHKRDGAVFAFVGVFAYSVTIVIDIFFYNEWVHFGEVASYGIIILVFMTSFILSVKSAKAYRTVESLSRQMKEMNNSLEEKIKERTAQLERTNYSLERTNDDLARLETSRRHLLSNISHDLGTPMTLIQGYVEALLDRVVTEPEQQHRYLQLIHNRITGLNRLINDLFQLSKLEARQMEFDIQPLSTEEFIRYFGDRYELEVHNAGLEYRTHVSTLLPPGKSAGLVKLDVDRVDQVLTNIIYNAMKHTPSGGLIQLHMIVDEHSLVVQVQDNGPGIEPQDLPHIFDRFYKKDKSRNTSGGGSGLGLSIAKEIIDYLGGRIWAQSRLGQGACIAFMLPLIPPSDGEDQEESKESR